MFSNLWFWLFAKKAKWVFRLGDTGKVTYFLEGVKLTKTEIANYHRKLLETVPADWSLVESPLSENIHEV